MYKIYYTHNGEITTIGVSDQPGEYIECDLKTMLEIQKSPQQYIIKNQKILMKEKEENKPARFFTLFDNGPGWICAKDNLFNVLEYAKIKPEWFDETKHSWVKYD